MNPDEDMERGDMAVLMHAGEIPIGSKVTKRTGTKLYTLVDKIRIFNDKGVANRLIHAEGGARFLAGTGGDFNVVAPDVLLLWRTNKVELLDYLDQNSAED